MTTDAIYPVMLSGLIAELQQMLAQHGDMPVAARGLNNWRSAKVTVNRDPCYWDGGFLYPAVDTKYHCTTWIRSKTRRDHPHYILIDSDQPEIYLSDEPVEGRDTIDGEPVPDYKE